MSHQQLGHTETRPQFKVSSKRPEKRRIDLAIPEVVVYCVIHYSTATPVRAKTYMFSCMYVFSTCNSANFLRNQLLTVDIKGMAIYDLCFHNTG